MKKISRNLKDLFLRAGRHIIGSILGYTRPEATDESIDRVTRLLSTYKEEAIKINSMYPDLSSVTASFEELSIAQQYAKQAEMMLERKLEIYPRITL
jgi:hypothetical protein